MDGYRMVFTVESSGKVEQLKIKIENILGATHDKQRLIFHGHLLKDERLLSDYDITDESE
ncbi:unnamed protein product, partial [Adineta ricciae]